MDDGIAFFKRGKTTPAEFNEKCGVLLQGRTSSMLGYPEGTRHTEDAPTRPLKTGMLRMAFKMGVCIQLVIIVLACSSVAVPASIGQMLVGDIRR